MANSHILTDRQTDRQPLYEIPTWVILYNFFPIYRHLVTSNGSLFIVTACNVVYMYTD